MTGRSDKSTKILDRQAKVREYLFKRYTKETIAKILGSSLRTIERDAAKVWEDVRKQAITKPMEQNIDEAERGLLEQINEARIQYELAVSRQDNRGALSWHRLLKDLQDSLVSLQQKAGRATLIANRVDVVQRVIDNPLFGLYDDSDDKKSEPDSGSKI